MNRYYILTEHNGVRVIMATTVDESDPFTIRFVTDAGTDSFERHELLWWSPVESSPQAPFSNFDRQHHAHPHRSPAAQPWEAHGAPMSEAQRTADFSRRSAAAMSALVEAVRPRVPPGWRKAALELKVHYELPASRYSVTHRLRNPDTEAEAVDFSDALFAAIEVFHRIAVEGGQNWNETTLTLHMDGKGRCREAEARHGYGTNFGPR